MLKITKKIRNRLLLVTQIVRDPILKRLYPKPRVATIDETIDRIVQERVSVSRYGDGELDIINGKSIPFQKYVPQLGKKMAELLKLEDEKFLVCLPDVFGRLDVYKEDARIYWKRNMRKNRPAWNKYLKRDKQYYNTYISRFYYDYQDKSHCDYVIKQLKHIWNEREIVIVEGEKSRLGVGNDLFNNARSIKRILCPATNAFAFYEQIIKEVKKLDKNNLILLALGPTATVLAYDLYKLGYQAVDIGHVDIEYEWYLMKATTKVAIKDKYTNEATTDDATRIGELNDPQYLQQIVAVVKEG